MSVVCAKVYEDRIEIAADNITIRGGTQDKKYSKLSEVNSIVIGGVGLAEENSLFLIYCSSRLPSEPNEQRITEFISEFADWKKKKTDKFQTENDFIIIFKGKAFYISGFLVREIIDYQAIGAGMDYALASLYLGHDVEKSVEVACELSIYCERPIKKIVIKR